MNMRVFVLLLSAVSVVAKVSNQAKGCARVKIVATGSSTVCPIAQSFAGKFDGNVEVSCTGSSAGLKALLEGSADIGLASRALAAQDYVAAGCPSTSGKCGDVSPKCIKVANDAIAIITSPDLDLGDLTLAEVAEKFGELTPVVPSVGSGTRDFFLEVLPQVDLEGVAGFADDAAQISALAGGTNSIGFVGIGAVTDDVNIVSIGGVTPSSAGANGGYPFFRPLFMCYNKDATKGIKTCVVKFLCGVLGEEGQSSVVEVGQLPLSSGDVSKGQSALGC